VLALGASAQGEEELVGGALKIEPTLAILTDHLKALVGCVACGYAKRRPA
jgi:Zn ribbon nucleic-acid-binding protein